MTDLQCSCVGALAHFRLLWSFELVVQRLEMTMAVDRQGYTVWSSFVGYGMV
jgi:hypothetical protein